jgi:hypothetical protein
MNAKHLICARFGPPFTERHVNTCHRKVNTSIDFSATLHTRWPAIQHGIQHLMTEIPQAVNRHCPKLRSWSYFVSMNTKSKGRVSEQGSTNDAGAIDTGRTRSQPYQDGGCHEADVGYSPNCMTMYKQ